MALGLFLGNGALALGNLGLALGAHDTTTPEENSTKKMLTNTTKKKVWEARTPHTNQAWRV